jgi:hypothetical protein
MTEDAPGVTCPLCGKPQTAEIWCPCEEPPEYWLSTEPSAIDEHARYVDLLADRVQMVLAVHRATHTEEGPINVADKFLDQLKAEVEAANAAKAAELAAAQKEADERGKAFLDKVTKAVTDHGGKSGGKKG